MIARTNQSAPSDHQEPDYQLPNALARTRTAMPFSTSTSSLRVYQFHHEGDPNNTIWKNIAGLGPGEAGTWIPAFAGMTADLDSRFRGND